MTTDQIRFYDVHETAAQLGLSAETVRRKVRDGVWPSTRLTRHLRFTDADIQEIVKLSRVAPTPRPAPRKRKAA